MACGIQEIQEKATPLFRVTITDGDQPRDISALTNLTLKFVKPTREELVKAASFDTNGTDGVVTYKAQKDDITGVGVWSIQFIGDNITDNIPSETSKFKVRPNL